jgi:hypothetical protein
MPVSPLLVAILFGSICAGAFAFGLKFFRMSEPRGDITVAQARRFGRLLMMSATAMFLFLIVLIVRGELPLRAGANG